MKYAVTMLTINREPHENYIYKTLNSFGWYNSDKVIAFDVYDSGSNKEYLEALKFFAGGISDKINIYTHPDHKEDISVGDIKRRDHFEICNSILSTTKYIFKNSIKYDVDYIIFVEDDIIFAKDFINLVDMWLGKYSTNEIYLYSMCCTAIDQLDVAKDLGFLDWPAKKFWGAQCLLFRKDHIGSFLRFLNKSTPHLLMDTLVHRWLAEAKVKYIRTPAPKSFVQHIGLSSTWRQGGDKVDPRFAFIDD